MEIINKVGFGGGCHWCTEAVFQQVSGVAKVDQGWISSEKPHDSLSEAVIVCFDEGISLEKLIEVHLATHSSSSSHAMRKKYRSAVYYFDEESRAIAEACLNRRREEGVVTLLLPYVAFKRNQESYIDYYRKNPEKAFCTRYIAPKLEKVKSLITRGEHSKGKSTS